MSETTGAEGASTAPVNDLETFLARRPPGSEFEFTRSTGLEGRFPLKAVQMHCSTCKGPRYYDTEENARWGNFEVDIPRYAFLFYKCRNCRAETRIYAISIMRKLEKGWVVYKIGEFPAFGEATPASLLQKLGAQKAVFFQGRRAENLGLGIGALAYYRRVVEELWVTLLESVRDAARVAGADEAVIKALTEARLQIQFKKAATEIVPDVVPESVRIGGQNPFVLLHQALSTDLHTGSDNDCLEVAQDIRRLLIELVGRCSAVLTDDRELKQSVARLAKRASIRGKQGSVASPDA